MEIFSEAQVIGSASVLILTVDANGAVLHQNEGARRYFGPGVQNGPVQWLTLLTSADLPAVESAMAALNSTRLARHVYARLLRADGEPNWHRLQLQVFEDGNACAPALLVVAIDVDECKRACDLHAENEARLLCAFEAAELGAWEWDLEAGDARITPVLAELYGIERDVKCVPLSLLSEKVIEDERQRFVDAVNAALELGGSFEIEFPVLPAGRTVRWLRMRGHAQRRSLTGRPRVFGVTFDVSEIRSAAARLRQSERRYRELARSSGALVWSADQHGEMQPIDGEWEAFTGLPPERLAGHKWLDLVHPDDRDEINTRWAEALRELGVREATFRMRRADGAYRFMLARAVPMCDERGKLYEWFGTTIDATEQRRARAMSEARNLRLAVAMEAASIVIVTLDLSSYVFSIESANAPLLEESASATMPYDEAMSRVHKDDRPILERSIRRLSARQEETVHFEVRIHRSREERWMNGSAALQRGRDGSPDVIVASLSDVSERKRMEIALHDADKRKDEFLAMLAHELRNPLAPLRTVVSLLHRGQSVSDPEPLIATMERQISHMTRLVDDLLEVSRITQGRIVLKREPLLIGGVVYGAAESVAPHVEENQQTLTIDVPRDTVWVCGDTTRMAQILVNVLHNSSKYTPAGGEIRVRVSSDPTHVRIVVEDTGAGIAPDLLPHIFDLFSQGERTLDRSKGGLGIGLSLVRKLVEMHQGSIRVESRGPGCGTTVIIVFPRLIRQDELPGGTEKPMPARVPRKNLKILIVDDNRDAADSLSLVCQSEGHATRTCYGPEEAIQQALSFQPDVALLDIGLPQMDGYELAGRLRAKGHTVPVLIAITGYGQAEDRLKAQAAGFDRHFVKPVDINALLDLLSMCDSIGAAGRH
ncbi:PAS domain-containing protein [Caballeronia sp. LZ016]|uniref:hybrid sensor histidine kinase/response regulator n=1 Tax=Caballeronia sp. LZ016 TaxID=3038554 RepID=UPI00286427F9|nr:PAS domain-containing protein [Caballeronia sp. LZ016]MDR5740207.1 PAS domain-containing protein [Caballeronia sp. LZ016]